MITQQKTPALARLTELIDKARFPRVEVCADGYADVLGGTAPPARTFAQRLMRTTAYSTGYQALRPLGLRLAGGPNAPGRDRDREQVADALALVPGRVVVDIGCGPGNFTGWFGTRVAPNGCAIGIDASRQMLHRACADNGGESVAYLRADAEDLPLRDGVADAVTCLAALYLINDPHRALSEIARILRPGGRVVVLTSLAPGGVDSLRSRAIGGAGGVRMFGRDEITSALSDLGFTSIDQWCGGLAQKVTATKS
ncbi:class I SAM-dependent methyltransferase [Nocardia cyriacigeorgica]|uniref:Methyltransferase domain-containing protein n=1 Tax=Nocardia cyriacigeorgica TaxID=135487 RepID=A0A5R8NX06_9NOCA|nr:methyltransferase domain-containing protein [Nocardia cyriacigeorgica]TLF80771.1 methyltransferase domain-containing protein [Nocardia cyriacigeorgica]